MNTTHGDARACKTDAGNGSHNLSLPFLCKKPHIYGDPFNWLFKHIEWLICLLIAMLSYGAGMIRGMDRANHYWQWELSQNKAVKLELVASVADAFPGRKVWLVETVELMTIFAIGVVFVLIQKAVFGLWRRFRLKHK